MAFWVLLLIWVAETVIGQLLKPKLPGSNQNAASPDVPTAKAGDPINVFFGRVLIAGNVTWWGDLEKGHDISDGQEIGTFYYLGMQQVLAWGPVDVLFDIWLDKTKRLSQIVGQTIVGGGYSVGVGWGTTDTTAATDLTFPWNNPYGSDPTAFMKDIHILARNAFGGKRQGGGVEGDITFHTGYAVGQSAPTDPYLDAHLSDGIDFLRDLTDHGYVPFDVKTNLPNLCYVTYRHVYMGTSANILPWLYEVGRYPNNLGDAVKCRIGDDANPAEMIWEILTSKLWGVGAPVANLDMASFQSARDVLYAEGSGMSMILSGEESADTTLDDILRHIDGVMVEDPITGLLRLKLIRADYNGDSLVLIADTNKTAKSVTMSRTQWRELLTDVIVNYTDRSKGYNPGVYPLQNQALWEVIGERLPGTIDYKGFTTADNVKHAAERALRTLSTPLARGQIVCEGVGRVLAVGDVFLLSWAKYEFDQLPVRATKISYGADASDPVTIDYAQDIFGQLSVTYEPPPGSVWTDPRSAFTLPTVDPIKTETPTTGQLDLAIDDPDSRVILVEFDTQVGGGTRTGWVTSSAVPYFQTIVKDTVQVTTIYWRVTYTDSTGAPAFLQGSVPYDPAAVARAPRLNPVVQPNGDVNYAASVDPSVITVKFAFSKVGFPTLADARAGTVITTPFTGTVLQATSTLEVGETLYFTTLGYDAVSSETPASFESVTRVLGSSGADTFEIVMGFGDGISGLPLVGTIADFVRIKFDYRILSATIVGDTLGDAVVDIRTAAFANPPVFASIAGTSKPTLTAQTAIEDAVLATWSPVVAAGSLVDGVLELVNNCKKVTVTLTCRRE